MPYTGEQALALAQQLGPLYGFGPDQIPFSVFDSVLNGLEICQAFLDAIPQYDTPQPYAQAVSTDRIEPPSWGWHK